MRNMKVWIDRLIRIENKALTLCINDQLDQWLKDHIQGKNFSYWGILSQVPGHLKMPCLDRAVKQMREEGNSEENI